MTMIGVFTGNPKSASSVPLDYYLSVTTVLDDVVIGYSHRLLHASAVKMTYYVVY